MPPPKPETPRERSPDPSPKRAARIVQPTGAGADEREREREKLLSRLIKSEGRSATTRAANDYRGAGFEFPNEQAVQLSLLEHFDEEIVRQAISALAALIGREPVLKRPVLQQRLKRLEDTADEEPTRVAASELRRSLRA